MTLVVHPKNIKAIKKLLPKFKRETQWEEGLKELVYAYNRGSKDNPNQICAITDSMHNKLIKFVQTELAKQHTRSFSQGYKDGIDECPKCYQKGREEEREEMKRKLGTTRGVFSLPADIEQLWKLLNIDTKGVKKA